jgi:glycerol-3-phosphate acyltransferase PlsY
MAASLALILAGYLLGSISPTFLAARLRNGIDLRRYGSGNVGSSNLGEQLGPAWAIGIGTLDFAKGLAPVLITRLWGFDLAISVFVGIAAVIGHDWSLFLKLTGGRGMGTAIGVLVALDVRLAVLLFVVLGISWITNQGAPGSAVGLILLTPGAWFIRDAPEIISGCAALALVVALKRLEANRMPLPADPRERMKVLLRRLWMDRDVPSGQAWETRKRID